jgi:uncharacterized protein
VTDLEKWKRRDVEFDADGTPIRGWLYLPEEMAGRVPVVVMAGGFSCVKEMHLGNFAEVFAAARLAVLLFDFRNLGASGGLPRQELNPWQQAEDYRHAITYATTLPEIDSVRIGIWGSSYSGGHCLVVAATDRRVKCVSVQVPTISGRETGLRRVPADKMDALAQAFAEDRVRRMKGDPPAMRCIVGKPDDNPLYPSGDAREYFSSATKDAPSWRNQVTLRSTEFARSYEPGTYVPYISPTPLLMIVGRKDSITCADLELAAYNRALEPKKLVLLEGGHFAPYQAEFELASGAARDWFLTHL